MQVVRNEQIAQVDLRGVDAGPVSEWIDLVKRGLVKRNADLVLVSDVARMIDKAVAAERDCRTCAHHTYASGGCVSALRCVGGDRYHPTQPRQLWEQRPPEPAPF